MQKQTIFVITVVILMTAALSISLYNVRAANAQGNMFNPSTNMTKSNMTGAALATAKNMTGNISATGKAIVMNNAMNKSK